MLDGLASTQTQVWRPAFADSGPWLSNVLYIFIPSLPCPMPTHTISQHLHGRQEAVLMSGKLVESSKDSRDCRFCSDPPTPTPRVSRWCSCTYQPAGSRSSLPFSTKLVAVQGQKGRETCGEIPKRAFWGLWWMDSSSFPDLNPCGPSFFFTVLFFSSVFLPPLTIY